MAVDTARKRRAFQSLPWGGAMPFPDGHLDAVDRFTIQGIRAFSAAYGGMVDVTFTARQPGITYTASQPGIDFTARQPGVTFTAH